jgi:hypothetical protein
MPRLPTRLLSRRAVPWSVVLQGGMWIARRGQEAWSRLSRREQDELRRLLAKSRGRRANLTERERSELWRIVKKGFAAERR